MTLSIDSLTAHQHLKASMTACSWSAGWRSLLLRAYVDPPVVDELRTPPTADHLIVLVTGGSCDIEARYRNGWQRAHYEAGCIGMTAPRQEVALRWRGETPHSTLQLHLPDAMLRRVWVECSDRDPTRFESLDRLGRTDPVIQSVMLSLAAALEAGAPELYAETAAEFLATHLLVRYAGLAASTKRRDFRMERVEEYMRAHLCESVSLEAMANHAGLSRFQFLRAFKKAHGETPMKRLTRLRMEHAKRLLCSTANSITDLAFQCGYENPSHFASAFRRWTGTSPSDYRGR
jgi:AraC family transcriptional regulator